MGAPNYLLRNAVSARAAQEALGGKIVVVLDTSLESETRIKALCRSFGITKFINIHGMKIPYKAKIRALMECLKVFLKNNPDQLLKLSYNGINMGHLLYDDILHNDIKSNGRSKHYTINRIDAFCIKHIYNFYIKAYIYDSIMRQNDIRAYVSTHTVYTEYGILPFMAVERHIPVVYSDDYSYAVINVNKELYAHDRIRHYVDKIIQSASSKELIARAEKDLRERMDGYGNVDTKLAYSNDKRSYERKELVRKLGIKDQKPIVFIFAHVFRDSPHISSHLLYRDYYQWLEDTLVCADQIDGVNWVVKEHPSGEKLYKEKGGVSDILKRRKLSNIFSCPPDLNTKSIAKVADAVLTCQGTVGIECSCLGIPAVVCGKAFYTGFGFTIEPKTIRQYREILGRMKNIKKLSDEQIEKAKEVYSAYQIYYGNQQVLLNNDILDCVWGYSREQSVEEAYRLINAGFDNMDFIHSSLYQDIYQYFENREMK